jgi:MFS transporter, SHS family, lactate transporter
MTFATNVAAHPVPWWREPTKDQWYAWVAAWLGWMLDAFDFTIFLLILVPVSKHFGVELKWVGLLVSATLYLRLVGAVGAGWLCDRVGRKGPLMLSILWYSICNFVAGFSPNFAFLFVFRALLGIGMGAEWPAGAALAMETWPARSRGLMSGLLQGSWGLGYALASVAYWNLFDTFGWRAMLWLGILPALVCVYIRFFVKESDVWEENKRQQTDHTSLFTIFKKGLRWNTFTACFWMSGQFIIYYSMFSVFAAWLQKDLQLPTASVAKPVFIANMVAFFAMGLWGGIGDKIGRRWAIIIPAALGCLVAPIYLTTSSYSWIVLGFALQGCFSGAIYALQPAYLTERFPTEVRATASAFCYHFGALLGGSVPFVLTYLAVDLNWGFAQAMLYGIIIGACVTVTALLLSPETKGKSMTAEIAEPAGA